MKNLLSLIFTILALTTQAQMLHFRQLTVKDGLPHNSVITLAQDSKDKIWVATFNGLCLYDGNTFSPLPSDELPDKRVDRINRAADGTMWVQCYRQHDKVSYYDTLTHHFTTYDISTLSDSIRKVAVRPLKRIFADPRSSRVWSIEKRMLWQTDTLQPDTKFSYTEQKAIDAGLKDETFYTLLLDNQGILWAGSANNGLFFADTHQNYYRRLVCQPYPTTRAVYKDNQGTLWIAIGDQQLITLPQGANTTTGVEYPMTDSIEGRRVRAITQDSQERIWIGTRDGLYVKEKTADNLRHIDFEDKKTTAVFCFFIENDEKLWIGTDRGVFCLPLNEQQPKVQLIDKTVDIIGKILVENNRLWISTDNGLYCRTNNTTTQWYPKATHKIVVDARGQIWVGTDNGLLQVTEQGLQPFSTAADGHAIKDIICWRDFLWCSYEQGLFCVNIYTGNSTTLNINHNEYLDGSACIDAQTGTLYFGGTLGIDCFQADELDEQLRSGVAQLWLEEECEELKPEEKDTHSFIWLYAAILFVIAAGSGYTYYYIRSKKAKDLSTDDLSQTKPNETSPFILKATEIAKAHIADADFTAEQMAQELAMSRTKLFLLMRKETGKAVKEFIRDIRLDYAAQQLAAGAPINEIYLTCGFSDPSSFRRSFAKKYGINPSHYREQQKNG